MHSTETKVRNILGSALVNLAMLVDPDPAYYDDEPQVDLRNVVPIGSAHHPSRG